MCMAIPGKIISMDGDIAVVDYELEQRECRIVEGNYSVGDYVIVQVGMVTQKIPEEDAKKSIYLIKKL